MSQQDSQQQPRSLLNRMQSVVNKHRAKNPINLSDTEEDDTGVVPPHLASFVQGLHQNLAATQQDFLESVVDVNGDTVLVDETPRQTPTEDGADRECKSDLLDGYYSQSQQQQPSSNTNNNQDAMLSPDLFWSPPPNPVYNLTDSQVKEQMQHDLFQSPPPPAALINFDTPPPPPQQQNKEDPFASLASPVTASTTKTTTKQSNTLSAPVHSPPIVPVPGGGTPSKTSASPKPPLAPQPPPTKTIVSLPKNHTRLSNSPPPLPPPHVPVPGGAAPSAAAEHLKLQQLLTNDAQQLGRQPPTPESNVTGPVLASPGPKPVQTKEPNMPPTATTQQQPPKQGFFAKLGAAVRGPTPEQQPVATTPTLQKPVSTPNKANTSRDAESLSPLSMSSPKFERDKVVFSDDDSGPLCCNDSQETPPRFSPPKSTRKPSTAKFTAASAERLSRPRALRTPPAISKSNDTKQTPNFTAQLAQRLSTATRSGKKVAPSPTIPSATKSVQGLSKSPPRSVKKVEPSLNKSPPPRFTVASAERLSRRTGRPSPRAVPTTPKSPVRFTAASAERLTQRRTPLTTPKAPSPPPPPPKSTAKFTAASAERLTQRRTPLATPKAPSPPPPPKSTAKFTAASAERLTQRRTQLTTPKAPSPPPPPKSTAKFTAATLQRLSKPIVHSPPVAEPIETSKVVGSAAKLVFTVESADRLMHQPTESWKAAHSPPRKEKSHNVSSPKTTEFVFTAESADRLMHQPTEAWKAARSPSPEQERKASPPKSPAPVDPALMKRLSQPTESRSAAIQGKNGHQGEDQEKFLPSKLIQPLPQTSHLLQSTTASNARKSPPRSKVVPRKPPTKKVVTGVSDRLMRGTVSRRATIEATTRRKGTVFAVDDSVAKARARIRERQLKELRNGTNGRNLTKPKTPKFATTALRGKPVVLPDRGSNRTLAESAKAFGRGLRGDNSRSVGQQNSGPKPLTIPQGPKFSTTRRARQASPSVRVEREVSLAQSSQVLSQGLRRSYQPAKKRRQGPTIAVSPKFHSIPKRKLPKSSEQLEREEMERQNAHRFKARPLPGSSGNFRRQTIDPVSGQSRPSFMQPTRGHMSRRVSLQEPQPPKEVPNTSHEKGPFVFRARPAPVSTHRPPPPLKHKEIPFHLASVKRHEAAMEEQRKKQEIEENERKRAAEFKAMPVPKSTYQFQPVVPKASDLVDPFSPEFVSKQRAKDRKDFDEYAKGEREILEAQQKERELQQAAEEEAELLERRRLPVSEGGLIPTAEPVNSVFYKGMA